MNKWIYSYKCYTFIVNIVLYFDSELFIYVSHFSMDILDIDEKYQKIIEKINEAVTILESIEPQNTIDDSEILKLLEPVGGMDFGLEILRLVDGKLDAWDDVFSVIIKNFYNHEDKAYTSDISNVVT